MSRGRRKPPAPAKRAGCLGVVFLLAVELALVVLFLTVLPWVPLLYLALIGGVGCLKAVTDRGGGRW